MNMDNLRDVYHEQLKDMYSAENQLIEALPKMAEAANSPQLKQALQEHLNVTERQAERVQQLMNRNNINPGNKKCKAMEGLLEEGKEMMKKDGDKDAIDAGIICAAQKVEHYEIASYGTLRTWAMTMGDNESASMLQQILDEEYEADKRLTAMAESFINENAKR